MSVVDSRKPPRHGKEKRRKQKKPHKPPNKSIETELHHFIPWKQTLKNGAA